MVTFSDLLFAIAAEVVERSLFPRAETVRTFFSSIDMAILLPNMSRGSCLKSASSLYSSVILGKGDMS